MARPLRLAGSLAVLVSLWLPWYGIDIPDQVRNAFDDQAGQLPQGFDGLARGLFAALAQSLRITGWQALHGADVLLAVLAAAAALSVILAVDVRAVLGIGGALAAIVLVHIADQPGPNELVSVKVGPWVALVGAAAIALSARDDPTPARAAPATVGP